MLREEPSQLGSGEETSMRGISRRLELVQRGRLAGVVGGELVDDEHVAARPRHPGELGDDTLGPPDVVERTVRARQVELGGREPQRLSVSFDEPRIRQGACLRQREELRHRVDTHDLAHKWSERERERAGSGADVERATAGVRLDEVAHLPCEELGTAILAGGNALRRARESLSR